MRVHTTFHERRKFPPYKFASARRINSIQKRWGFIQQEYNKFGAVLESVETCPVSGLGVGDLAFQSIKVFKAQHKNTPFTLTHCWTLVKDCPKFKDQYAALKKKGGPTALAEDGDVVKRPRGKTNSKIDENLDATSFALQETLHGMLTSKKVRGERKHQGKEEQMKIYLELQTKKFDMKKAVKRRRLDMKEAVQTKKLAIEAINADTKAKKVALTIMSVDLTNLSSKRRSWFENRQKKMFDQDDMN
ncbi:hypothetical protein VPH35_044872 [Triticum aestivum]